MGEKLGDHVGDQLGELSLRPFVEADEGEVSGWFADAGELRFFAGPLLSWPLDARQWRGLRVDPRITAWTGVLAEGTSPIAHGELVMESADNVRLARLAVSPRQRGRGLGRAMVLSLIEKSRADRYRLVSVDVHRDNSTAIRAYRGCGFQPSGAADTHAQVRMELLLA